MLGCLAWLFGSTIFSVLVSYGVYRFSLPESPFARVGTVEDFQSGQEPQLFLKDNSPFFVVKVDDEVIALSPYSRRGGLRCMIRWVEREYFEDPCWGTRLNIEGKYKSGPPWEMIRFPVHIIDGEVWVEVK
jgi:hypothetical protein